MYLAEEMFRRRGIREQANVIYASATAGIFGIPKYAQALNKIVEERNIQTQFSKNLVEVRPETREAVFRDVNGSEELVLKYDMMHVTPPQGSPSFIRRVSPLANAEGWVDVDKHTLQHTKFRNVFSLGDCSSLPCSKTGAAVRKQAPALVENMIAFRAEKPLTGHYDGYASCPLVTGYGKVILAEFGYDGVIMETFPFDQAQERYSMYALKAYGLPNLCSALDVTRSDVVRPIGKEVCEEMEVKAFFDAPTFTLTFVVLDEASKDAVVIDSVLNYNPLSSQTSTESLDELSDSVRENGPQGSLRARDVTRMPIICPVRSYSRSVSNAKTAIGEHITAVQEVFKGVFDLGDALATDGSQFDKLIAHGDCRPGGQPRSASDLDARTCHAHA